MPELILPSSPTPTTTLSADDFIQALNGYNNFITVDGLKFCNGIEAKKLDFSSIKHFTLFDNLNYLIVYNAIINTKIVLTEFHNKAINILFHNCIINEINISNSDTGNWQIGQSIIEGFSITNKSNTGFVLIINGSKSGKVVFKDSINYEGIRASFNSFLEEISIGNDSFCGAIYIRSRSEISNIRIEENSTVGRIYVEIESQGGHFFFRENSRIDSVFIGQSSQIHLLNVMTNCKLNSFTVFGNIEEISIRDSAVSHIYLKETSTKLYFSNLVTSRVSLENCALSELEWVAGSKGEIYMLGGSLLYLHLFNTSLLKDSNFCFSNVSFYLVELETLFIQGQLIFRNVNANKTVRILRKWNTGLTKDLYKKRPQYGSLESEKNRFIEYIIFLKNRRKTHLKLVDQLLSKVDIPTFRISNSSLGKTEITGSDLSTFKFEYRDSKLLDCFISGTQLPKNKIEIFENNYPDTKEQYKDFYEQKVSIYNQLRKIFDNQGDIVEATWYQSKAMEHQQNLLKLNYQTKHQPKWFPVNKWFSEEGFDLFNFRLNKLSNNHGESWRSALSFIFLVSIGIYSLYYISLFHTQTFSFANTGKFLGDYFGFLDITHKSDFLVDKKELTPTAKFLDFVGRLFIGYGIYQFVAAFRRHGRK